MFEVHDTVGISGLYGTVLLAVMRASYSMNKLGPLVTVGYNQGWGAVFVLWSVLSDEFHLALPRDQKKYGAVRSREDPSTLRAVRQSWQATV